MSSADDAYEQQNDAPVSGAPAGDSKDNDYVSRTGQYQIPVQKDEAPVHDPIDPATADSDQTLGMFSESFENEWYDANVKMQLKTTPTQLTRVMSSAAVLVVLSHLEAIRSQVMRRDYRLMMGPPEGLIPLRC